ncbi:hypothetical protein [Nonomuraea zeae]|uniref:hypothetical protein n=1 Tax=Nonomuraea zeae TaxID=1642303 RepID=UPI00110BA61C|nr:hypothetical protein [Nonomuraea zeae]
MPAEEDPVHGQSGGGHDGEGAHQPHGFEREVGLPEGPGRGCGAGDPVGHEVGRGEGQEERQREQEEPHAPRGSRKEHIPAYEAAHREELGDRGGGEDPAEQRRIPRRRQRAHVEGHRRISARRARKHLVVAGDRVQDVDHRHRGHVCGAQEARPEHEAGGPAAQSELDEAEQQSGADEERAEQGDAPLGERDEGGDRLGYHVLVRLGGGGGKAPPHIADGEEVDDDHDKPERQWKPRQFAHDHSMIACADRFESSAALRAARMPPLDSLRKVTDS